MPIISMTKIKNFFQAKKIKKLDDSMQVLIGKWTGESENIRGYTADINSFLLEFNLTNIEKDKDNKNDYILEGEGILTPKDIQNHDNTIIKVDITGKYFNNATKMIHYVSKKTPYGSFSGTCFLKGSNSLKELEVEGHGIGFRTNSPKFTISSMKLLKEGTTQ